MNFRIRSGRCYHYKKTPAAITVAVVTTLGLAFNIWFAVLNRGGWGVDFNQFYAASRLVGTGHLYDWDALRKIEAENGREVPTGRLPVVLYGRRNMGFLRMARPKQPPPGTRVWGGNVEPGGSGSPFVSSAQPFG